MILQEKKETAAVLRDGEQNNPLSDKNNLFSSVTHTHTQTTHTHKHGKTAIHTDTHTSKDTRSYTKTQNQTQTTTHTPTKTHTQQCDSVQCVPVQMCGGLILVQQKLLEAVKPSHSFIHGQRRIETCKNTHSH